MTANQDCQDGITRKTGPGLDWTLENNWTLDWTLEKNRTQILKFFADFHFLPLFFCRLVSVLKVNCYQRGFCVVGPVRLISYLDIWESSFTQHAQSRSSSAEKV